MKLTTNNTLVKDQKSKAQENTELNHMDAFGDKYNELQSLDEDDLLPESLLKTPYIYYSSY